MARIALIKDGKVANVVEGNSVDHIKSLGIADDYDDVVAVETKEGGVGKLYDGNKFHDPAPNKSELLNHVGMRIDDYPWVTIKLDDGQILRVDVAQYGMLAHIAAVARANANFTAPWPQHYGDTHGYVALNAKQIIELSDKIAKLHLARLEAHRRMIDAVNSGKVTDHAGIDDATAWPPGMDKVFSS